jgi:hypothetical protein
MKAILGIWIQAINFHHPVSHGFALRLQRHSSGDSAVPEWAFQNGM